MRSRNPRGRAPASGRGVPGRRCAARIAWCLGGHDPRPSRLHGHRRSRRLGRASAAPPTRAHRGTSANRRSASIAPKRDTRCATCGAGETGSQSPSPLKRGGKVSEDIVVPLDRLAEAIDETLLIGRHHGLAACSWGHAGDGNNLHSTFLLAPDNEEQLAGAHRASQELFELAIRLSDRSPANTASGSSRAASSRTNGPHEP